jgi:hypothetical protein
MRTSRVAGACRVRNAIDLVPYICGHYLRCGFELLCFLDDGSTDGTFELLEHVAVVTRRVRVGRVERSDDFRQNQPDVITSAVNDLIAEGFDIVLPFDIDEFWNVTADHLISNASFQHEGQFLGHLVNFVQDGRVIQPARLSLLRVRYRCLGVPSLDLAALRAYKVPFVASLEPKIGVKSQKPVRIALGQHGLLEGPTNVILQGVEVFHIPLRARSEITRRARDYAPRVLANSTNEEESRQLRFFAEEEKAGRLVGAWAANSADRAGRLTLAEDQLLLFRDDRFRLLMLKAAAHFLRHCPRVGLSKL